LRSIAFCCISTGVFVYPNRPAAQTVLETIEEWMLEQENRESIDVVVFNVFKEVDRRIYSKLFVQRMKKEKQRKVEEDTEVKEPPQNQN